MDLLSFDPNLGFVKRYFKKYYTEALSKIKFPLNLPEREFAFLFFDKEEMLRHISFTSEDRLNNFIKTDVPAHIYYSSAYYLRPQEVEMELKGWKGADLIFDIDSDHLNTPCKRVHDRWSCLDCGTNGSGARLEECPYCGSKRLESRSFYLCQTCLESAKDEVFKLVEEFLIPDFSLSSSEVYLTFSGRRGYHVHVESKAIRELSQYARKEIVDYVKAIGIKAELHGFHTALKGHYNPPSLNDPGWRGKIARGVYTFISTMKLEDVSSLLPPLKKSVVEDILSSRDSILKAIESSPPKWTILHKYGKTFWRNLLSKAIELQYCKIDERVTTDIKRLVRMPTSLHGDTGLVSKPLTIKELETFNPLTDAVALKEGEVKVYVEESPRFVVMEREFGPFRKSTVELPNAVAVYLIRTKRAQLAV